MWAVTDKSFEMDVNIFICKGGINETPKREKDCFNAIDNITHTLVVKMP